MARRDFKILPAAFAGLVLLRRRPLAALGWALVGFAVLLLIRLKDLAFRYGLLNLADAQLPVSVILDALCFWVGWAVIAVGVTRGVLGDAGSARLRLGAAEARLMILTLLLPVLLVLAAVLCAAPVWLLGERWPSLDVRPFFREHPLPFVAAVMLALGARFALAPSVSVAVGGLGLQASWRLTRGLYWRIIAALGLATALGGVITKAGIPVVLKLGGWMGAEESLKTLVFPDTFIAAALVPGILAELVLRGGLAALTLAAVIAPAAWIYRTLTDETVDDQVAA